MIFEKTSTRTRCPFEVVTSDQGAHAAYLGPDEAQLGQRESTNDTARVLGRMFDDIELRDSRLSDVETLDAFAGVPVWNGLTDNRDPTQSFADLTTMRDNAGRHVEAQVKWLPSFHNTETEIGRKLFEGRSLHSLEVTDDVFESRASLVFAGAENRLHTIKALMVATLAGWAR